MRKISGGLVIVLLILAAFIIGDRVLRSQPEDSLAPGGLRSKPLNTEPISQVPPSAVKAQAPKNFPARSPIAGGQNSQEESFTTDTDRQFQDWLRTEAKSLDAPSVNSDKKSAEIGQFVKKLTPQQAKQLLVTARDPHAPAAEKILSTYLLVQGQDRSHVELEALITSPLPESGPREAHSEAEMLSVREKTLRIMAIDGMFSRAQKDPRLYADMARLISDIEDPFIRSYARQKYERLQPQ